MSQNIFRNCIKNVLGDKTRILSTHNLQILPEVDLIVVLKPNGACSVISEIGTYDELVNAGSDFYHLTESNIANSVILGESTGTLNDFFYFLSVLFYRRACMINCSVSCEQSTNKSSQATN